MYFAQFCRNLHYLDIVVEAVWTVEAEAGVTVLHEPALLGPGGGCGGGAGDGGASGGGVSGRGGVRVAGLGLVHQAAVEGLGHAASVLGSVLLVRGANLQTVACQLYLDNLRRIPFHFNNGQRRAKAK